MVCKTVVQLTRTRFDQSPIAPLALRAAKQAISRSEDLPLETGKSFFELG